MDRIVYKDIFLSGISRDHKGMLKGVCIMSIYLSGVKKHAPNEWYCIMSASCVNKQIFANKFTILTFHTSNLCLQSLCYPRVSKINYCYFNNDEISILKHVVSQTKVIQIFSKGFDISPEIQEYISTDVRHVQTIPNLNINTFLENTLRIINWLRWDREQTRQTNTLSWKM